MDPTALQRLLTTPTVGALLTRRRRLDLSSLPAITVSPLPALRSGVPSPFVNVDEPSPLTSPTRTRLRQSSVDMYTERSSSGSSYIAVV